MSTGLCSKAEHGQRPVQKLARAAQTYKACLTRGEAFLPMASTTLLVYHAHCSCLPACAEPFIVPLRLCRKNNE